MVLGARVLLAGAEDGPYPLGEAAAALRAIMEARARQSPEDGDHASSGSAPAHARLFTLDLGTGPPVTRAKAALGIGWHARDHVRSDEGRGPEAVDLVIELGGTPHHLLGLGRVGVPSARLVAPPWRQSVPDRNATAPLHGAVATLDPIDRLAADEGACLLIPEPVVRSGGGGTTGGAESATAARALADRAWLALPYGAAAAEAGRPPWDDWWPRVIDALLAKEPWRRLVPGP